MGYIQSLFPHPFSKRSPWQLLYARSFLLFCPPNLGTEKHSWGWKAVNLAAGIELLGMGCDSHLLDIQHFGQKKGTDKDNRYTLNLLFGDIFYSRAVEYLIRFEDSLVFEEVIKALKQVHQSRLNFHQTLLEVAAKPGLLLDMVQQKTGLLLGINALLKSSFLVGWSLFIAKDGQSPPWGMDQLYKVFNLATLAKSLQELQGLLTQIEGKLDMTINLDCLKEKKHCIKNQLDDIISQLHADWLKNRLRALSATILEV